MRSTPPIGMPANNRAAELSGSGGAVNRTSLDGHQVESLGAESKRLAGFHNTRSVETRDAHRLPTR
jgi:hypothetical protein